MSSFIWPHTIPLSYSERGSTPVSNHCSPLTRSVLGAWMTNPSVAWLVRAPTHTYTNTCRQSYYVTPALRRVKHMLTRQALPVASSTPLSSRAAHHYRNLSHFHLHHLSLSHWWRERVPIIFSPTQSGGLTFSPLYHLLSLPWKEKRHNIYKFPYCIWHPTHAASKILSARSCSFF